jgi:lipopolysaccharide transport protein LptA
MAGRWWRWTKVARAASLLALAGLVVVVVAFVVGRLRDKPPLFDDSAPPIGPDKVEVRNQVKFVEFRGDQSKVEAAADKQYKGADGLSHLEGHVLIIDHGKTGGREIRMGGDAAVYDEGWTKIRVRGNATVQLKGLTAVSTEFDYDKATESVRSSAGVRVVSPRLNGTAEKVAYSIGLDEIVFEGALDFVLAPRDPAQAPVRLGGRRFLFNQTGRFGVVEGDVLFTQGPNSGRAGFVRFELSPDSEYLSRVEFRDRVEMALEDSKAPPPKPASASSGAAGFTDFISFRAKRQAISAGHVILLPFPDTEKIQALLLREGSRVALLAENGNTTELAGTSIEFIYTPAGDLRDFTIEGQPRLSGTQAATNEAKVLEGARMVYDGNERTLRVRGAADRPAKLLDQARTMTCGILALYFRLNSFDAADQVFIVSTPQANGRGTSGFFSRGEPVFIRADVARYNDADKSFWLSGQVRMVQGRESLFVRQVTILEETGEMKNAQEPLSTFIHASKSREKAQEERVTIEAATLAYDPKSQKIYYGGTGILRTRDIELRASSITVDLAAGEIQKVLASGNVSVNQNQGAREATGGQAVYDAAAETIVLTDRPVLKDKVQGSARGEKLTFFLADGRIVVENRDDR